MRKHFLVPMALLLVAVLLSGCRLWPLGSTMYTLGLDIQVGLEDGFQYPEGVDKAAFKGEIIKTVRDAIQLKELAKDGKYKKDALAEVQIDISGLEYDLFEEGFTFKFDEKDYLIAFALPEDPMDVISGFDGLRPEFIGDEPEPVLWFVVHMHKNRDIVIKLTVEEVLEKG